MPLNVATSIVDFLKSRGFKGQAGQRLPFFETQKSLYENLGLGSQLGEYRGTAVQNPAILNKLAQAEKQVGVGITPENILDILRTAQGGAAATLPTTAATAPPAPNAPQPNQYGVYNTEQFRTPTTAPETTQEEAPATFEDIYSALLPKLPGRAQTALDTVFKQPSADELAKLAQEKFAASAELPLKQEIAQHDITQLQLQEQRDKESLINKLASAGLFFSGRKEKGLKAIEADTLAKKFNIDKNLALFVAQGLETAAQQVAKEAQQGSERALSALEKLGFTINPLTGAVEPTAAARQTAFSQARGVLAEERAAAAETRAEAREERAISTEERAVRAAERADIGLQLQLEREERAAELAGKEITSVSGRRVIVDKSTGEILADLGSSTTGRRETTSTPERNAEVDALARSYLRGETLGNIGLLKGDVLVRAEEIQREEVLQQFADPNFVATKFSEAIGTGDTSETVIQDMRAIGVPEDKIQEGLRVYNSQTAQQGQKQGFFQRLFGGFGRAIQGVSRAPQKEKPPEQPKPPSAQSQEIKNIASKVLGFLNRPTRKQ